MVAIMPKQDYVTVYVSPQIKKKFKIQCTRKDKDMSTVAAQLIRDWLISEGVDVEENTTP